MGRRLRDDKPGTWYHVVNRAIARRTLFERRADFRHFEAQLALSVRRGEIEVHAFCLMGTHYHLLIRSLTGRLDQAMARIQNAYSRWFNRIRKRDGSLVRGRYTAKEIKSLVHRRAVVKYIDENPRKAKIVTRSAEYPYGSATMYASKEGPIWLERSWVESAVRLSSEGRAYSPVDYARVFGRISKAAWELIEARLKSPSREDGLDDLVGASSLKVQNWMRRKARLADGTRPGIPIVAVCSLVSRLELYSPEEWPVMPGKSKWDGVQVAHVGLGRDLCGMSGVEVARALGVSPSTASRIYRLHQDGVLQKGEYATRVVSLAYELLRGLP